MAHVTHDETGALLFLDPQETEELHRVLGQLLDGGSTLPIVETLYDLT